MKKIGIVADNYKVDEFKSRLNAANLGFECLPLTKETTAIKVDAPEDRIKEVYRLCEGVESYFAKMKVGGKN